MKVQTKEAATLRYNAYQKFKLHWMIQHDHTIEEILKELIIQSFSYDGEYPTLTDQFHDWEEDRGFEGEKYPTFFEFVVNEYRDRDLMASILTPDEMSDYLCDIDDDD